MEIDFTTLVIQCHSFSELSRKIGKFPNTRTIQTLRKTLDELGIDFSHFSKNQYQKTESVTKLCPICNQPFVIPKKNRKTQTTCSYSCSNVYFARKRNKPENYKNHRTICWYNHDKKCVVCGEDKIVAVHHMDENPKNNDPKNLIPLCPTHHTYWHSRYRHFIREKVDAYLKSA